MQGVRTIGLDIAKSVFQVHGVDAAGNVLIRRQIKRRYVLAFFQKLPPCVVGIEACATSHHWSRQLQAIGNTVRLMPPADRSRTQPIFPARVPRGVDYSRLARAVPLPVSAISRQTSPKRSSTGAIRAI
jgi:hypothetical protein